MRNQSIPVPRPVLSEERCRHILEISNRDGCVLVGDLARQFRTPQVTIRKDLDALQAHGRIYRSHGGALPARENALEDPSLREEEKLHRKEKMHIAAQLQTWCAMGRSSCLILARSQWQLRAPCASFKSLTIITNALNIAAEPSGAPLEVILTCGTLRKNSFSLVGPIAEETLYRLNGDILISGRRRIRCSS